MGASCDYCQSVENDAGAVVGDPNSEASSCQQESEGRVIMCNAFGIVTYEGMNVHVKGLA